MRFVRLYGQAGRVETVADTDVTSTLYQLGAVSPIGLGFLMGSYGYAKDRAPNSSVLRRTFSIGYDYFLSKATDIYAVVMNERVDRALIGQHGRCGRAAALLKGRRGRSLRVT